MEKQIPSQEVMELEDISYVTYTHSSQQNEDLDISLIHSNKPNEDSRMEFEVEYSNIHWDIFIEEEKINGEHQQRSNGCKKRGANKMNNLKFKCKKKLMVEKETLAENL